MNKLAIAIILVFACCSTALADKPTPLPDSFSCAECGMKVRGQNLKFASEIVQKDGKTRYFCDLGDLFLYYEVLKDKSQIASMYVRDYSSGEWCDAKAAFYLTESTVTTPMRFGIISFSSRAAADKFKKETGGGAVMGFQDVVSSKIYRR